MAFAVDVTNGVHGVGLNVSVGTFVELLAGGGTAVPAISAIFAAVVSSTDVPTISTLDDSGLSVGPAPLLVGRLHEVRKMKVINTISIILRITQLFL